MKESAIDCGLLKQFHAQSHEQINCGTHLNEHVVSPVEEQIESYKRGLVKSDIETPVFRYNQHTIKKRKSKKNKLVSEDNSLSASLSNYKNSASWNVIKSRKNRR